MRFLRPLPLLIALFCCLPLTAQRGNPAQAADATLEQQFEDMLAASNRYQQFRVVRQDYLNAFLANVRDSVGGYTTEIDELKATITTQRTKIDEQAASLTDREGEIRELNEEKDSVSLFGLRLSKATYALLLWGLIGLLVVGLLLALARMRLALGDSKEARRVQEKTAAELEASRKSRLAVEQKLSRQLQDERNKRLGQ